MGSTSARLASRSSIALIAAIGFLFVSSARAEDRVFDPAEFDRALSRIVEGKGATAPIASAAIAVMVGDRIVYEGAAGCAEFARDGAACVRAATPTSKMRVASISKLALALGIETLVADRRIDLDEDVSTYLGWELRNPAFPSTPITIRQLMSHKSSVIDPDEYWVAAPGSFRALFAPDSAPFDSAHAPGAWFRYSNLNYGILAGVIEAVTHERFDRFMTSALFEPNGLDIGYNWSGVTAEAREQGVVQYLYGGESWTEAADAPSILNAETPAILVADGVDASAYLDRYTPGENPTLFSPQGGLRASVDDLLLVLRMLRQHDNLAIPQWRVDPNHPNGETEGGYYSGFGLGVQLVEGNKKFLKGASLIGHPGEAYGLFAGAWILKADATEGREEDISIAFAATGVDPAPKKGAHPTFNALEERLMRLALKAAKAGGEPRPFAERADAKADIGAALSAAKASGRKVIVIFGANWCRDSRGLAKMFATPPLKNLIENNFELVWVDVGVRDKNLDIVRQYGAPLIGTPTVLILSADGAPLNVETASDWRKAESRTLDEALVYFGSFSAEQKALRRGKISAVYD